MTAKQITGPLRFEPHNLAGTEINGEPMPFGYISTKTPMPVFELNVPLNWPEDELTLLARQMATAPEMFDLLVKLVRQSGSMVEILKQGDELIERINANRIVRDIRNG